MNAVVPRDKLAAVLGMLGSQHDGEVLNAARAAERLRQASGLSWADLLSSTAMPPPELPASPPQHRPQPHWRDMVAACRRHPDRLTAWEREFIASLANQATLSRKQWAILADIAKKKGRAA